LALTPDLAVAGKAVRISGSEEWQMDDDGLIAESRGQFDAVEYQRQLEHGYDPS
jgi:predicted ester cyclase